jgi:hypothetical protein
LDKSVFPEKWWSSAGGNKVLEEKISPEIFWKENEILQKIGSPGIEGKNVHRRLRFGVLDEKWGFFPGNNPQ